MTAENRAWSVKGKFFGLQFAMLLFPTRCEFLGWVCYGQRRNFDLKYLKNLIRRFDLDSTLHSVTVSYQFWILSCRATCSLRPKIKPGKKKSLCTVAKQTWRLREASIKACLEI